MKFITFMASAMLIAIISQHSIMGLPLNDTLVCSEGMELINGQCMPISSLNTSTEHGNFSHFTDVPTIRVEEPVTKLTPVPITGRCPEGMKHGEHGICEEIQPSTSTELNFSTTTTTEMNLPSTHIMIEKSSTPQLNIESTTPELHVQSTTELNIPSTTEFNIKSTTPEINVQLPTEFYDLSTTTELNTPSTRILKVKSTTPEINVQLPTEYHDLSTTTEINIPSTRILKVKSTTPQVDVETPSDYDDSTTTEINIPSTRILKVKSTTPQVDVETPNDYDDSATTTTERDENVGGVDIIKGCPKGTQPDEDGACVSTQPKNSTKAVTNLKALLIDGSCPPDYKMIQGRCLYIKPKKNLTSYETDSPSDNFQTGARPKSGIDAQSEDELVPVLDDNSCPEGTEYSEFGLCRKRIGATTSRTFNINEPAGDCDDGYQFINGKCVYKTQSPSTKSARRMISTTTPFVEEEELSLSEKTSTVAEESAYENHYEETPSPLSTK